MNFVLIIVFFVGCSCFTLIERKTYIPYIKWVFIIPFCLLIANRSVLVPDTDAYLKFFNATDNDLNDIGKYSFEIGFQILTKIIKYFVADNVVVYFACIVIINLLLINWSINRIGKIFMSDIINNYKNFVFIGENRFFKNSIFSILPLTLYVAFFGIYVNAIVMRAGLATSLLLVASTFALKQKKNIADYFVIIALFFLGSFFHMTILIGVIVLIIMMLNVKLTIKTYLWIWFGIGFIYFSNLSSNLGSSVFSFVESLNDLSSAASKLSSSYEGNVVQEVDGISVKFVFFWIMALVLILNNISSKVYFKLLNVYLVGIALFALFRSVTLIERVTDFFLLFSFVIFYLFLIMQKPLKFWLYFIPIVFVQLVFVLRITN